MFGFIKRSEYDRLYEEYKMLEVKLETLAHDNCKLRNELNAIKPVVENKNWEPAVSRDCGVCAFVVRSKWNGSIIGCRKNCVCKDFRLEEKANA